MKRMVRGIVAAVGVAAVVATPGMAAAAPQPELQKGLDQVVAAAAVGAVAEVRDGRRTWRGTSGVAELGTTRPVPVMGQVRIGSVTKTFVATVVLQLVAEGRLRLNDSVEKWLPGVVPNGQNITVRELLNHTSGLFDYKDTLPAFPPDPKFLDLRWRTWTAAEQIQQAVAHPPTSDKPGTEYKYSNTNYLVLGEIIAKVTGRTYSEEITRRLIRPLHLRDTVMPGSSTRIPEPHPHGYIPIERDGEPTLVDFTQMNPTLFGAGGDMISTPYDVNRFFTALLGGRLLPAHLLREMKTPGVKDGTYGLGLAWRETSCKIRVYGNDGDALAYQAYSFSTADTRRQVTVAVTPDFGANPDDTVDAFIDKTICH
jgi:D-alanyl-D-alanine carboxypeptidase